MPYANIKKSSESCLINQNQCFKTRPEAEPDIYLDYGLVCFDQVKHDSIIWFNISRYINLKVM